MIDAATFANSYNAFWLENAPMCEHFVRRLNIEGLERFEAPMPRSETQDRAYIAEYAFSLFVEHMSDQKRPQADIHEAARRKTDQRLWAYLPQGLKLLTDFDEEQKREVGEITSRLMRFCRICESPIILRPRYRGCGYIDESEGDVIGGKTIYEVKTVDRRLRSVDVRQVITYAALNFCSGQFQIENVGVVNPRRGLFFELALGSVCSEISGQPAADLLGKIVDAISSGSISR